MRLAHQQWFMVLSIGLVMGGCAGQPPSSTSQADPGAATSPEPEQVAQVARTEPIASPSPEGNLPEELDPSQEVLQRLPQANAGRANPFGAIAPGPIQVRPRTPSPEAAAAANLPAPPIIVNPAAVNPAAPPVASAPLPATPLPPVPVVPASPSSGAAPPGAPAVAAPPPSLASQIRISGIVQIGNQLNVLVEVPNGGGSRPVRVGEDIVTGRVRLARVDVSANQEPQIVLEEGGVETIKTVDSGV